MSIAHFERLIADKMNEVALKALAVELGDSHMHAFFKGVHDGLKQSLALYRQAARTDLDGDL